MREGVGLQGGGRGDDAAGVDKKSLGAAVRGFIARKGADVGGRGRHMRLVMEDYRKDKLVPMLHGKLQNAITLELK